MLTFKLVTRKHHTWKNCESQSLTNQILKDEIEKTKKNSIIQKDPKPKLEIKRIRIKIEIKNKLDDNYQFSIEE
jgi:hypothetical protein